MSNSLVVYLAGIGTVVVALGTGLTGGILVGDSWGGKERPAVAARNQDHPKVTMQRREVSLAQTAAQQPTEEQINAAKTKATAIAAERKKAADRRKVARAERRKEAERRRQIAAIAADEKNKVEIAAAAKKIEDEKTSPGLGYAPKISSGIPLRMD